MSCSGRTTLAPRASVSWAGRKGRGSARVCRAVHPHPNPLPSRERGCCARQVPACAGMTGGCAGLSSCFTLTLTLSHRGRGDVAPGTALLGSRLRGNDGRVRGFVELFHPHPNPLPSRERGCCTRHCPSGLPPIYGCHLRNGRLAAVASSSRVFGSVCGARTICSFDDQEGHAGSSFCPTRPISRCATGR